MAIISRGPSMMYENFNVQRCNNHFPKTLAIYTFAGTMPPNPEEQGIPSNVDQTRPRATLVRLKSWKRCLLVGQPLA